MHLRKWQYIAVGLVLLTCALFVGIAFDSETDSGSNLPSTRADSTKSNRQPPVTIDESRRVSIAKRIRYEELKRIRALDPNIDRFDVESVSLLQLYETLYPERYAEYESFTGAKDLDGYVRVERTRRVETLKEISILLQFEEILTTPDHKLIFDREAIRKMEQHLPYLIAKLNGHLEELQLDPMKEVSSLPELRRELPEHLDDLWNLYDAFSSGTTEVVANDTHYLAHNQLIALAMREDIHRQTAAPETPDKQ